MDCLTEELELELDLSPQLLETLSPSETLLQLLEPKPELDLPALLPEVLTPCSEAQALTLKPTLEPESFLDLPVKEADSLPLLLKDRPLLELAPELVDQES